MFKPFYCCLVCFCSEISFQRCPTRTLFIRIFRVLNTVQSFIFKVHVVAVLSGNVQYFITSFSLCQQFFYFLFESFQIRFAVFSSVLYLTRYSRVCQQLFYFSFQTFVLKRKKESSGIERRKRDLNPRAGCPTYTLSRGASSAS